MTYAEMQTVLAGQEAQESRRLKQSAFFVGLSLMAIPLMRYVADLFLGQMLAEAKAVINRSTVDRLLYYMLYVGLYCFMLLLPVAVMALLFRRAPALPSAHRQKVSASQAVLCVLFGMAFCVLANYLVDYWLQFLSLFGIRPLYGAYNNDGGWLSLTLNLVTYALMPGLVEELVFRGWLLGSLQPFGERRALVLSALIFGLAHGNFTQLPFAFLLGLLFGFLFLRTGRLWLCMAIHFLNNAMSVLLDYASAHTSLGENGYMLLQLSVFAGLVAAGIAAGLLLYTHRTARPLTRPMMDRRSVLPAARRARLMWLNPAVLTGLAVMVLLTVLREVSP